MSDTTFDFAALLARLTETQNHQYKIQNAAIDPVVPFLAALTVEWLEISDDSKQRTLNVAVSFVEDSEANGRNTLSLSVTTNMGAEGAGPAAYSDLLPVVNEINSEAGHLSTTSVELVDPEEDAGADDEAYLCVFYTIVLLPHWHSSPIAPDLVEQVAWCLGALCGEALAVYAECIDHLEKHPPTEALADGDEGEPASAKKAQPPENKTAAVWDPACKEVPPGTVVH